MSMTTNTIEAGEISRDNYAFLQQYVYRTSGIVLDENKHYLLEARLAPIIRKENLKTINDLCALIRATSGSRVSQEVVEAMTTNETLFFRDAIPFKVLRNSLLPPLIEERKSSRKLTFWSAASSSGQEAYSLAMMLCEMGLQDWNIEIRGTDLNEKMVERARRGAYAQIEVNRGLPATHLVKYFERDGLEWRVKDVLRRMVRFEKFDLRQPMRQIGPFDFLLCRNVLIYFDVETKKTILAEMEKTMHHGAYLLLGAAETTMNLSDAFERNAFEGVSFYRKK
jgi:chemotaxis protein methyltransferase CheR